MASIIPGYEYDIFISYRQKDNKHDGWITEFVDNLKGELESTFKEDISVYFDINPHDGLLETHDVAASLKAKLKCLVFIPIISRTYCDPKSYAWEHEFKAFIEQAESDQTGLKVKLSGGNVARRVLPVQIHDLDAHDKKLVESELGGFIRGIEFIYMEPGVNRPLRANEDHPDNNLNKTFYRNQINKVANAIKEILTGLKYPDQEGEEISKGTSEDRPSVRKNLKIKIIMPALFLLVLMVAGYLFIPKIINTKEQVEKSIAVLSFIDMSPGKDQEYLGDGMAEEILDALTKIKGLKVIGRTSSFSFKGKNIDLKTIGQALGASTILEGSVQKSGHKIRITAQLINARNDIHIWSERYDSELEDIFSVQDDIADKIVQKLKGTLFNSGGESKVKAPTNNIEAYEMLLRARNFREKGLEWQKTALEYYQKAINLDPSFAQAYSELSEVYWNSGYLGISNQNEAFSKAEEAALRAIKLDESSYDGYNMLSFINLTKDWDWQSSLNNYNKAVSLGLPLPDMWHAYYQCWLFGCNNQIIKEAELMVEKDPLSVEALVHLSRIYCYAKRYDNVIINAKKTLEISPDQTSILRQVGEAYLFSSRADSALPYFQKLMGINARYVPHDLIAAYIKMGNKETALAKFNELKESMNNVKKAICYIYFGEKDKAFASLEDAYREKDADMIGIKIDSHFESIRSDPRFLQILKKMKFPE
jgi:TolB-like protein/tetratricopeptide (TPR) repeat protein